MSEYEKKSYVALLKIKKNQRSGKQIVQINNFPSSQIVSANSLPLPTGAASESTLSNIEAKIPTQGQTIMTNSIPVTIASNQTPIPINMSISALNGDAFSRLKTTQPYTLFEFKAISNEHNSYLWDDVQVSGSGTSSTYNTNQASITLGVTSLTAGRRLRQSYKRIPYTPGKGQEILFSGILGTPSTGITRYIGIMDNDNGLYFISNGTTVGIGIRTSTSGFPVDTIIAQTNWNIDTMDGNGPSGITINWSKVQIFIISFQWLGVGIIIWSMNINGTIYNIHYVNNSNVLTTVYMSNSNLPLRYEIINDGTGGAETITQICSTAIRYGGAENIIHSHGLFRSASFTTGANTDFHPIISIQLKSTSLSSYIIIKKINIITSTNGTIGWKLIQNPTITGTALSFTAIDQSGINADIISTNATTITGGHIIDCGVMEQTNNSSEIIIQPCLYQLGVAYDGTSDILTLAINSLSGSNETVFVTMTYYEQL
jgi:hypothetical protein